MATRTSRSHHVDNQDNRHASGPMSWGSQADDSGKDAEDNISDSMETQILPLGVSI